MIIQHACDSVSARKARINDQRNAAAVAAPAGAVEHISTTAAAAAFGTYMRYERNRRPPVYRRSMCNYLQKIYSRVANNAFLMLLVFLVDVGTVLYLCNEWSARYRLVLSAFASKLLLHCKWLHILCAASLTAFYEYRLHAWMRTPSCRLSRVTQTTNRWTTQADCSIILRNKQAL